MKKSLALLLAVCMMLSALVGCSQQGTEETEGPKQTGADVQGEETPAQTEVDEPVEKVTIDVVVLGLSYQDSFENFGKDSEVYKEIVKQTGVELTYTDCDADQAQIRMAGGELGDLVVMVNKTYVPDLVDSELVLPLNDLVEQYAPEIMTNLPDLWAGADDWYPNDEGLAYILPVNAGNEGVGATNNRYLYTVRWDLYKELGYPAINNTDDMIKVLSDMVALEPTTADGKTVYGESFYVTSTSLFGMVNKFAGTYGMVNEKSNFIHRDVQTDEIYYSPYDDGSPYWMAAEYFNKAYRAGILDPDSFTQKAADFTAKIDNGQLICGYQSYSSGYEDNQLALDPDSVKGFVNIPVEGCMFYQSANQTAGWGASYALAIPKTCENPEAVMRLLSYLYSEEGARTVYGGVEGVHWDYVDGVPVYNDETFALAVAGGDAWKETGIGLSCFKNMSGIVGGQELADGSPANLKMSEEYLAKTSYSPVLTEFCEYYDVSWPNEIFVQWRDEGKMYDLSNLDYRYGVDASDEDIDRIDSACVKIAIEAIPKLVMAADDAAFEAAKAEVLADLEAAGALEAREFYNTTYAEARAAFAD